MNTMESDHVTPNLYSLDNRRVFLLRKLPQSRILDLHKPPLQKISRNFERRNEFTRSSKNRASSIYHGERPLYLLSRLQGSGNVAQSSLNANNVRLHAHLPDQLAPMATRQNEIKNQSQRRRLSKQDPKRDLDLLQELRPVQRMPQPYCRQRPPREKFAFRLV